MTQDNEKPNIIFITVDALRARNLSCYGYKRKTSPNIDFYASQGVLFKNFFSLYNCSHKSFFSILSGRHLLAQDFEHYPSQNEMKSFFDTGGTLLSEILQKQGYKTGFLRKLFGWQKIGFNYYFEEDSHESSKKWNLIRTIKKSPFLYKLSKYALNNFYWIPKKLEFKIRSNNSGETATNKAIEIIKANKKNNFFIWLHYTDTHVPHIFPYSFSNKFKAEEKSEKIFDILNSKKSYSKKNIDFLKGCWKVNDTIEDIIAKYDTAISYTDSLIAKLVNILEEEDLLKNTIVFILADHGESLAEHGLYFTHGGLYDVSFNVPLIIFGKGIPKNKKIDTLVQSKDLAPTILDLSNIDYDSMQFDGKSLLPLMSGETEKIRDSIFIEEQVCGIKRRGIRTQKYKYVESPEKEYSVCNLCHTTHGPITALYDLKKDPEENFNLAKQDKKLLNKMKSELDKTLKDMKTLNEKRRIKMLINIDKLT